MADRKRKAYYIREQRNGKRYKVSTRAHNLDVARAEYHQWSTGPETYRPGLRSIRVEPLLFDDALVDEFMAPVAG